MSDITEHKRKIMFEVSEAIAGYFPGGLKEVLDLTRLNQKDRKWALNHLDWKVYEIKGGK